MDPSHTNLWSLDDFFPVPIPSTPHENQAQELQGSSSPVTWPPQLDNIDSGGRDLPGSISDASKLSLLSFDVEVEIDPMPLAKLEKNPSVADGRSSHDIAVKFLPSCSSTSTPADSINKLIDSKLFQALVKPTILHGAPIAIEVDSVGSSAAHEHNVWKFICTPKFLDGSSGPRHFAFVCNNPFVPKCDRVMAESGSMRNHQTTQGHGKANIVCERCQLVFKTARNSAFKRHKDKSCANRQKRMAHAAMDRAKRTRKIKEESEEPAL